MKFSWNNEAGDELINAVNRSNCNFETEAWLESLSICDNRRWCFRRSRLLILGFLASGDKLNPRKGRGHYSTSNTLELCFGNTTHQFTIDGNYLTYSKSISLFNDNYVHNEPVRVVGIGTGSILFLPKSKKTRKDLAKCILVGCGAAARKVCQ